MFIKAIILGIIEGLTEFLPVSSTGHLILANSYLSMEGEFGNLFAVVIQIGAILSVVWYFRDKLIPSFNDNVEVTKKFWLWFKVAVACVPAVVLALLFDEAIEKVLFKPVPVAMALIFGAFLLFYADRGNHKAAVASEEDITMKQAIMVGFAQCMALIPGMSRSASTIIGGLLVGFSRPVAAEFSFFLGVPLLLGAGFYKLLKSGMHFTGEQWIALGIGTVVSYIVAYFVIAAFMGYIKKRTLAPFAWYRIALGILVIILTR